MGRPPPGGRPPVAAGPSGWSVPSGRTPEPAPCSRRSTIARTRDNRADVPREGLGIRMQKDSSGSAVTSLLLGIAGLLVGLVNGFLMFGPEWTSSASMGPSWASVYSRFGVLGFRHATEGAPQRRMARTGLTPGHRSLRSHLRRVRGGSSSRMRRFSSLHSGLALPPATPAAQAHVQTAKRKGPVLRPLGGRPHLASQPRAQRRLAGALKRRLRLQLLGPLMQYPSRVVREVNDEMLRPGECQRCSS